MEEIKANFDAWYGAKFDAMHPEDRETIQRSRVAAGIALLNTQTWSDPWYFVINLNMLNIANSFQCVLGQLFDDYMTGLQTLGINIGIGYGFSGVYPEQLTEIWREEITKLRRNHVHQDA